MTAIAPMQKVNPARVKNKILLLAANPRPELPVAKGGENREPPPKPLATIPIYPCGLVQPGTIPPVRVLFIGK
jgi:hypothetical protein